MEVVAVYVTVNCNQVQSGSSGFKTMSGARGDREQHQLKKIHSDTCTRAVKHQWNSCEQETVMSPLEGVSESGFIKKLKQEETLLLSAAEFRFLLDLETIDISLRYQFFLHSYLTNFIIPLCKRPSVLDLGRNLGAEHGSSAYTPAVQMWASFQAIPSLKPLFMSLCLLSLPGQQKTLI